MIGFDYGAKIRCEYYKLVTVLTQLNYGKIFNFVNLMQCRCLTILAVNIGAVSPFGYYPRSEAAFTCIVSGSSTWVG